MDRKININNQTRNWVNKWSINFVIENDSKYVV